jgi:hypothetical protein
VAETTPLPVEMGLPVKKQQEKCLPKRESKTMGLKEIIHNLKSEVKALTGEETKDKQFSSHQTFPDETTARKEFERAKEKLFSVNRWSDIPGGTATFELYDRQGHPSPAGVPVEGFFLRICFPGPLPENWVRVAQVRQEERLAEFSVNPCENPCPLPGREKAVEHFFTKEASSTFRVELRENTLWAFEIGQRERINNHSKEAGDRALVNTLIAEGGWAGIQKRQGDKLTRYLVHLEEDQEPTAKAGEAIP